MLDVGCGWDHRLLSAVEPHIAEGVGVDFKVPERTEGRIRTRRMMLDEALPFESSRFELVTMLAVLEHLEKPLHILHEIQRVLVPGGRLVLTVPHKRSQPVLEFLAYRVGVVSEAEIRDHKRYYGRPELEELFSHTSMMMEFHRTFQLGMNNFAVARKP